MVAPIVVMGVSGCGKSTVGKALAQRLGVPFADADDLHTAENIAKMTTGHPLDDADRRPWLELVGQWLAAHPNGAVMACSALRRSYRDLLRRHCPQVRFVHLSGTPELIARRASGRHGHFMPPVLVQSQFDALEPLAADENGITLDVEQLVGQLVGQCLQRLTTWVPPASSS
jgi:gluconokinase